MRTETEMKMKRIIITSLLLLVFGVYICPIVDSFLGISFEEYSDFVWGTHKLFYTLLGVGTVFLAKWFVAPFNGN